jgi:hypothetical protein
MDSKPPQLVVDESPPCATISVEEAQALEREIDSVKRELREFTEKTVTRLDGLRKRLLRKAA